MYITIIVLSCLSYETEYQLARTLSEQFYSSYVVECMLHKEALQSLDTTLFQWFMWIPIFQIFFKDL